MRVSVDKSNFNDFNDLIPKCLVLRKKFTVSLYVYSISKKKKRGLENAIKQCKLDILLKSQLVFRNCMLI